MDTTKKSLKLVEWTKTIYNVAQELQENQPYSLIESNKEECQLMDKEGL